MLPFFQGKFPTEYEPMYSPSSCIPLSGLLSGFYFLTTKSGQTGVTVASTWMGDMPPITPFPADAEDAPGFGSSLDRWKGHL